MNIIFTGKYILGCILGTTLLISLFSCATQEQETESHDDVGRQSEWHEAIKPEEKTDIVIVDSVLSPTFPRPGEQVEVSVVIENRSKTRASDTNVNLFSGRKIIGKRVVTIDAYEKVTVTFNWMPTVEGSHVLTFIAEVTPDLFEYNELNNTESYTALVTEPLPKGADLAIKVANQPQAKQKRIPLNELTVIIENKGFAIASTPLVIFNGEVAIETRLVGPLASREKRVERIMLPTSHNLGQLRAVLNPRFQHLEAVTENNMVIHEIPIPHDLALESLSLHAISVTGDGANAVVVNYDVTNYGETLLDGPTKVRLDVLKTNEMNETNLILSRSSVFYDITPGETIHVSEILTKPPHNFLVRLAVVESGDNEYDGNLANNELQWTYKNPTSELDRWVSTGPDSLDLNLGSVGRFHTLVIDPINTKRMYAGAPSGSGGEPGGSGVWATEDGGKLWYPLASNLPSLSITAMALDPMDSAVLYFVAANEGLYRCSNHGRICRRQTKTDMGVHSESELVIDPSDPQVMYLTSSHGVYRRTSDSVRNYWELWPVSKPLSNKPAEWPRVSSLVMDSENPKVLHAAVSQKAQFDKVGIWRTIDGGDNWIRLAGCDESRGGGRALPVFHDGTAILLGQSDQTLYATMKPNESRVGVMRTTNRICKNGEPVWEPREPLIGGDGPTLRGLAQIAVDPNDSNQVYIYFSGGYLWVSSDGGLTPFKQASFNDSDSPHMDFHGFAFDRDNSSIVYAATDGGIYKSDQEGAYGSWKFFSKGISNLEIYDIALLEGTFNTEAMAGTQDDGNIIRTNSKWKYLGDGDGGTVAIDQQDPTLYYGLDPGAGIGTLKRYTVRDDDSHSFANIACGIEANNCTRPHFLLHPSRNSVLLLSCENELLMADNPSCPAGSGTTTSPWTPLLTVNDIAVRSAVSPDGLITIVGTNRGRILATASRTDTTTIPTWDIDIFLHPMPVSVTDIQFDPANPRIAYVSFFGDSGGRVFRFEIALIPSTINPDQQTVTFSNEIDMTTIASQFPNNVHVRSIQPDAFDANTVYAATNRGVYRGRTVDDGATWLWEAYNNGLPPAADVSDLEIHKSTGTLHAATLGRSTYRVRLVEDPHPVLDEIVDEIAELAIYPPPIQPAPENTRYEIRMRLRRMLDKLLWFSIDPKVGKRDTVEMLESLQKAALEGRMVKFVFVKQGRRYTALHNLENM